MTYMGNLTCRDCGLTFTSQWGSLDHADEYRCRRDHSVLVDAGSGLILTVDGALGAWGSLWDQRGRCPVCSEELASGLLPACPVCGGRDHEVLLSPGTG